MKIPVVMICTVSNSSSTACEGDRQLDEERTGDKRFVYIIQQKVMVL